ncbi:hypothetical protein BDR03DRAFT_1014445 [Suillus americanus]|nr:hypothetical protein BDR03DRAFT_1014445 [Suillus americanus]
MTLVSNDLSRWPLINANLIRSYFIVAASVWLMYYWALTLGQEVELIWVSGLPHQKSDVKVQLVHGRGNAGP